MSLNTGSTSNPTPANNTPSNNPPSSNSNPPGPGNTAGSNDITISERFLSDSSWPADLILDLGKSNWSEWSFRLENLTDNQGFSEWLDGSLPRPDPTSSPKAHHIWCQAFFLGDEGMD